MYIHTTQFGASSNMKISVDIIGLVFFAIQNVFSQFNDNQCYTPDKKIGVCINIRNCEKLKKMLETQIIMKNNSVTHFLRSSMCGYDGTNPKVCCQLNNGYNIPSYLSTDLRMTNKIFTINVNLNGDSSNTISTSNSNTKLPTTQNTGNVGSSGYETVTSPKLPSQKTCGRPNIKHDHVLVGQPAKLGDWPWMAAIGYRAQNSASFNYKWLCGGSLISNRYVITAAHCTVNLNKFTLDVARLGDLDLNSSIADGANPIDIPVSRIIIHDKYNTRTMINDIALLKLVTNVRYNNLIQPICLPAFSDIRAHKLVNTIPFVSGWGTTAYNGPISTHLKEVQLIVVDNDVCKKAYANKKPVIDDNIVCGGILKAGEDACQGYGGGPLMYHSGSQYYLVGILSYGFKCAEPDYPGVYTRTSSFVDWIARNMNND